MIFYFVKALILSLTIYSCVSFSTNIDPKSVLYDADKTIVDTVSVEDFFRKPEISTPSLSPDGALVVYDKFNKIMVGNHKVGFHKLVHIQNSNRIRTLSWSGPRELIAIIVRKSDGFSKLMSIKISFDEQKKQYYASKKLTIKKSGYIVDPLPKQPNKILYAVYKYTDEYVYSDVFNVDIFDRSNKFSRKKRINYNSKNILYWQTNHKHQLALGVSFKNNTPAIWYRKDKNNRRFTQLWQGNKDDVFMPFGIDEESSKIWVVTNHEQPSKIAALFDLKKLEIEQVLFKKENLDVNSIVMNRSQTSALAVSYINQGLHEYHFIDNEAKKHYEELKLALQDPLVYVIETSLDNNYYLLLSRNHQNLGDLNLCSVELSSCQKIGNLFPWLESVSLANTQTFNSKITDDISIESYLTIPNTVTDSTFPLVVIPHGGPIGVRDTSYFSGHAQWLAYNDFAVLQVNYRGSGGYGKQFQYMGLQQWGRAIEDDIELSIDNAIANFPALNPEKICLFGSSYGGYSSLMGLVRSPDRFDCAASFAGVTDLPLLFNKSSVKNNSSLAKLLIKIIGDPKNQLDTLMHYSPVYRYKDIEKPILVIHGTSDDRVDIEHFSRLKRLIDLKPESKSKFVKLSRVGHSFTSTKDIKKLYESLMPFLNENLKATK